MKNNEVLALLRELDGKDAIYTRLTLAPYLPHLICAGSSVWTEAVSFMHTRFNRYLFLNAPELWSGLNVDAWTDIMGSVSDRSYAQGDVFSTGRFDDIKFLCHFVAIDAIDLYFRMCASLGKERLNQQVWVLRHIRACTSMYLPMTDPMDELDIGCVSMEQLSAYRSALLGQKSDLQPAKQEEVLVLKQVGD
jgi:hypothetical protein